MAAQHGLSVSGEAWAVVDRSALHRVLTNLVGNAVKFTDRGGVSVRTESGAGRVRLVVADTGRGIAPASVPHLFDEFRQASEGLDREHEGNGLGLTISKRLVDLMGGTITVESEPGVGTAFTVSLPITPAASDEAVSGDGGFPSREPAGPMPGVAG
ncbi:sensor histidine kinase [Rubrivirga sp.]|uniref:sensor histidine kinase n=1 Tax=Rubrivirga sp. TaxID=1885344 RepID=UPI003B5303C7